MKIYCPFKNRSKEDAICKKENCKIYYGNVLDGKTVAGVCANKGSMKMAFLDRNLLVNL